MRRSILAGAAALLLSATPAAAQQSNAADALRIDRVVILMRHGVRPPTKAPAMPAGVAAQAWPEWPVKPGYLTPHGAAAVALVGASDRAGFVAAGLLPRTGCARAGAIRILADSDQRTIATADAYAAAVAPGCHLVSVHQPQDVADPLFSPIDEQATGFDANVARKAVLDAVGPGGIAAEETRLRPQIARIDAILCGDVTADCGIGGTPSGLAATKPGARPKLSGALDRASTVGQILLLEYAEGKPMADVGWGRATPADIARASEFHAVEFRLLARPRYIAMRNMAGIAPLMAKAIADRTPDAPAITLLSGHDTNVASLAGLLDLHWQVPGLAADDPSPGGAIMLERLVDARGQRYVRAVYRSQTLEQIRALTPLDARTMPYRAVMPIAGCTARGVAGLCTLEAFTALMTPR